MTALWTPAEQDARMTAFVGLLPAGARTMLAKGPVPWGPEGDADPDGECRVCAALDAWFYGHPYPDTRRDGGGRRYSNGMGRVSSAQRRGVIAAVKLLDWHQGWDLKEVVPGFMLGRGLECFRRCVVLYRAAGWEGEVEAPPPSPLSI